MSKLVEIPQPSRFRIGELFKDNNFNVPLYQRNYAWGTNEIRDFWDDLMDIAEGDHSNHFFGQIVTFRTEGGRQEIIDGQQRITTSLIFMSVVRDIADKIDKDNPNLNRDVGYKLHDLKVNVEKSIRGDGESDPSLIVQRNSNHEMDLQDYFMKLTHKKIDMDKKQSSEPMENMRLAYRGIRKFCLSKMKEKSSLGERIDLLQRIFDSFNEDFYIVMISAPSRADAFTIFETLNSRGKDLTASDIIKNHIMSLLSSRIDDANDLWGMTSDKLDNNSGKITKFIRTYWSASKKVESESKLYRSISNYVDNADTAYKFLKDLESLVDIYTVLNSPTSPKSHNQFFNNRLITQRLDVLNRMHVMLYYPIILSMRYRKFDEQDILIVIQKIISVFVRHRTIANDGTNKLEIGFADIAEDIWSLKLKNVDMIISDLNEKLLKTNESMKAQFSVLEKDGGQRGAKKWTLIYLLSCLYENEGYFRDNVYMDVFNDDKYKLTHISDNGISSEFQNYIGNWTMVEKDILIPDDNDNIKMANALKKSSLEINKEISRYLSENGWQNSDILKRQGEFTDEAKNIW